MMWHFTILFASFWPCNFGQTIKRDEKKSEHYPDIHQDSRKKYSIENVGMVEERTMLHPLAKKLWKVKNHQFNLGKQEVREHSLDHKDGRINVDPSSILGRLFGDTAHNLAKLTKSFVSEQTRGKMSHIAQVMGDRLIGGLVQRVSTTPKPPTTRRTRKVYLTVD